MNDAQILVVDDDRNVLSALNRLIRADIEPSLAPVRVAAFASAYGALEYARHNRIHVIVADFRMPEMNGSLFLTKMRALQPDAARIMLSGTADRDAVIGVINGAGVFRFVPKPWEPAQFKQIMKEAIAFSRNLSQEHRLADATRVRIGALTPEEVALRELEAESPGITRVAMTEDGGILLDG